MVLLRVPATTTQAKQQQHQPAPSTKSNNGTDVVPSVRRCIRENCDGGVRAIVCRAVMMSVLEKRRMTVIRSGGNLYCQRHRQQLLLLPLILHDRIVPFDPCTAVFHVVSIPTRINKKIYIQMQYKNNKLNHINPNHINSNHNHRQTTFPSPVPIIRIMTL